MTNEWVLESNKLIAEFMGWSCSTRKSYNDDIKVLYDDNNKIFKYSGIAYLNNSDPWDAPLKFHKSWDWLMPVVEKIESLGVSTNIHYFAAPKKNSSGYYSTEFLGYTQILSSFDSTNIYQNKLESVYHMVIHFIKWYNDNK